MNKPTYQLKCDICGGLFRETVDYIKKFPRPQLCSKCLLVKKERMDRPDREKIVDLLEGWYYVSRNTRLQIADQILALIEKYND